MCSSDDKKSNHLNNTLTELNQAIEQWDTITNKEEPGQGLSHGQLKKRTKDLLKKLEEQLDEFSNN